jgi:predicted nucleotidyltransferase
VNPDVSAAWDSGMWYPLPMLSPSPDHPRNLTDWAVAQAFLCKLRGRYNVDRAILFGSRARGDHRPDSDLDLAVVLRGERDDFIDVKLDMAGMAFDVLLETGVLVQALPVWTDDLAHPERSINPALMRMIAAEGIAIE